MSRSGALWLLSGGFLFAAVSSHVIVPLSVIVFGGGGDEPPWTSLAALIFLSALAMLGAVLPVRALRRLHRREESEGPERRAESLAPSERVSRALAIGLMMAVLVVIYSLGTILLVVLAHAPCGRGPFTDGEWNVDDARAYALLSPSSLLFLASLILPAWHLRRFRRRDHERWRETRRRLQRRS